MSKENLKILTTKLAN